MAIYYLNASSGNDSSTGTSEATAWQHHPWMSTWTGSATLQAGDTVCMKRGDTWTLASGSAAYLTTAQSGTDASGYIMTTSYGSGEKPIIYISADINYPVILVNGHSFLIFNDLEIKHRNSTYVGNEQSGIQLETNTTVPHDIIITNCTIHDIPQSCVVGMDNAYNITIGDINATSTATASLYSNHFYDYGYAGISLLGCNPVTYESNFNIYYNYIHHATRDAINEYGIGLGVLAASADWPKYCYIRYNRVEDIDYYEAIESHGGSYIYIQDNYIKNANTNIAVFAQNTIANPILDHVWIERNILENPASPTSPDTFIKIYGAYVVSTNIYVRDNTLFFTSRPTSSKHNGIFIYWVDGLEISDNTLYNGPTVLSSSPPIYFKEAGGGRSIKNTIIKNNYVRNWAPVRIESDAITGIVTINNNIFDCGDVPGLPLWIPTALSATGDLRIYNNVLMSGSTPDNVIQIDAATISGSNLSIKNNILGCATAGSFYYIRMSTPSGTFTCNYNLYWNSTAGSQFHYGGSARTWSYWTDTLSLDLNSPNVAHGDANLNPRFVLDTSTFTDAGDFYLKSDSSAINAGTYVGLSTDFAGRTWEIPPTIGAYEYTGRTFYVSNDGSDNYSGTNDASAWQHHPWMSTWTGTQVLQAGDTIKMKRGDTWSIANPTVSYMTVGQSGTDASGYITTTAYGSGEKPIINISTDTAYPVIRGLGKSYITLDNLEISHFQAAQDHYNQQDGIIFQKDASLNVPHDWIITNCDIHDCPNVGIHGTDDSYNITIGDLTATITATATSYNNHIHNCGYAGIDILGRNPITGRSDWNIYYNYVHDIDAAGLEQNSYGIGFGSSNQGTAQGESDGWPSYVYVRFNRVENVPGWEGIETHGGTYIYFQDNYVYNCRSGISIMTTYNLSYYTTTIMDHGYIERNIVEQPGNHPIDRYGFIGATGDTSLFRVTNCYIRDNTCFYTSRPSDERYGTCISVQDIDGMTISGNHIYNGPDNTLFGSSAIFIGYDQKMAKNITINNNYVCDWDQTIYLYNPNIDGDVMIYNNIIYSPAEAIYSTSPTTCYGNISIYNNVLLSAGGSNSYVICFTTVEIAVGASLIIKNNIVGFLPQNWGYYVLTGGTISGTLTVDNNLYWNSLKATPFYYQGDDHNFVDWKAHGLDTHSPNTGNSLDPKFINSGGSYALDTDFLLQFDSSAKYAGISVGLTTDYANSTWNNPPSLGAYEYNSLVNGLIAYWKLDETYGNAIDTTGNGHTGTLNSGITQNQDGKINTSYSFNGIDGLLSVSTIALGTTFTISAWIKRDDSGDNYGMCFGDTVGNQGLYIGNSGKFDYWYNNTSHVTINNVFPNLTWCHFVITVSSGTGQCYVNGIKVLDLTSVPAFNFQRFGLFDDTGWETAVWKGVLDEVGIWNVALSQEDILHLYNSGNGISYPFSGTYGLYSFKQLIFYVDSVAKRLIYNGKRLIYGTS